MRIVDLMKIAISKDVDAAMRLEEWSIARDFALARNLEIDEEMSYLPKLGRKTAAYAELAAERKKNTDIIIESTLKLHEVDKLEKYALRGPNENEDYRISVAQYTLGLIYYHGVLGHPVDHRAALHMFRLSAEAGYADGQFYLGLMYMQGHGGEANPSEGISWIRKAAKQGHAQACYYLGESYRNGVVFQGRVIIAPNNVTALKWLLRAAEKNDAEAQFRAGMMYAVGTEGVPINRELGNYWIQRAANNGHPAARMHIAFNLNNE